VGALAKRLFGISDDEATFARRGFHAADDGARVRLEEVGACFLRGYHAALEGRHSSALEEALAAVEKQDRGFAVEGAAMALALLDWVTPWKRTRVAELLAGSGGGHVYMIHVGVGWALARLGRNVKRALGKLDPLLGWLAVDGYGFHEGYFHFAKYSEGCLPKHLTGYERRAFDQGVGRSLWFVFGAAPDGVERGIAALPAERHGDLWSGVGLAAAYAGAAARASLARVRAAAGAHRPALAQGAAFAAKARQRAGNLVEHTESACEIFAGTSAADAAAVTDAALRGLPGDGAIPSYEAWRARIQEHFGSVS
jgi:hypothetical protein